MKAKKIKQKVDLGIGKFRRFAQTTFRKDDMRRSLARRAGECARCGACCELAFECVFLKKYKDGRTTCLIHGIKWDNCKYFPITAKDIEDRDKVRPDVPCGYHFPEHPAKRGKAAR